MGAERTPYAPFPEQQYCAVLRRVRGGMQKLILAAADEDVELMGAIDAGLPEERAAALWRRWFALMPVADQRGRWRRGVPNENRPAITGWCC
jgi:hypothetical protein